MFKMNFGVVFRGLRLRVVGEPVPVGVRSAKKKIPMG